MELLLKKNGSYLSLSLSLLLLHLIINMFLALFCIRCIVSTHNTISRLSVFVKVGTKLIEYNFPYDNASEAGKMYFSI